LTRVKEGDFNEGKVADLEETKRCTNLGSVDGPEGIFYEDADLHSSVVGRWGVADESGGEKGVRILRGF